MNLFTLLTTLTLLTTALILLFQTLLILKSQSKTTGLKKPKKPTQAPNSTPTNPAESNESTDSVLDSGLDFNKAINALNEFMTDSEEQTNNTERSK